MTAAGPELSQGDAERQARTRDALAELDRTIATLETAARRRAAVENKTLAADFDRAHRLTIAAAESAPFLPLAGTAVGTVPPGLLIGFLAAASARSDAARTAASAATALPALEPRVEALVVVARRLECPGPRCPLGPAAVAYFGL